MNEQENAKKIVNAIGAAAEMAGILMGSLIKNGFTRKEAMQIVQAFIVKSFDGNNMKGE